MKSLVTALLFALALAPALSAQKMTQELLAKQFGETVNVIVQFSSPPSASHHQMVQRHGGVFYRDLGVVKSSAYAISASQLHGLAAESSVVHISEDHPVKAWLDNATAAVNAPVAWNVGLLGAGIGVAVIDSGISDVDDLKKQNKLFRLFHGFTLTLGASRVVYRESFLPAAAKSAASSSSATNDFYGHGEHVSGIIAGSGYDSDNAACFRTFQGMASDANLIDLRVLDSNGNGSDSYVIAAIQQAIRLKSLYNIRVMNLSLGHPIYESYTTDPLCQAVEQAWKAGIVVVVAAGNDGRDNTYGNSGYGTIGSPGNDPYVITVGAMKSLDTPRRSDDLIASYSSKGPTNVDHIMKPDLVAPGNRTVSLLAPSSKLASQFPADLVPLSYYSKGKANSPYYFTLSGTSMAAPVVSGAVVLLLQAHPWLTPDQVKARLMKTAYKTFPVSSVAYEPTTGQSFLSYYDAFTVGAGYLDVAAALADNSLFTGTALSPAIKYVRNGISGSGSLICAITSVCTTGANQTIWGSQVIWGNQTIWGNQVIWGNQTIWGNQVIWGNQTIWGNLVPPSSALSVGSASEILLDGEN